MFEQTQLLPCCANVINSSPQQGDFILEKAEPLVAGRAQQAANQAGAMAVIHSKPTTTSS
jgi:hypothetical protein